MAESVYDIVVIGGGPAGAMASHYLVQAGYSVCLVERRSFPRETLCGEFLSHEVIGILRDIGVENEFLALGPSPISRFTLCTDRGPIISESLGFTAFGLKRGAFDQMLLKTAIHRGVHVLQPAEAEAVNRVENGFKTVCRMHEGIQTLQSRWCIGAYGKSSPLDKQLRRPFAGVRSRINGIKFHVPSASLAGVDADEIRIYTGPGMYCGVNHVDGGVATICFLEQRADDTLPPRARLRELMAENKHFERLLGVTGIAAVDHATVYGTGNIFFGRRNLVEDGIFMVGDAGRVIAPLAGDGIGMAMQGARLLGRLFRADMSAGSSSTDLETEYCAEWDKLFRNRLRSAAALQRILFSAPLRRVASSLLAIYPRLLIRAIGLTRDRSHRP